MTEHPDHGQKTSLMALAALGVVFGDIGTSPLYAFRECADHAGDALVETTVLGILSLMTWTLLIVVTGKYAWLILRADNEGEGGILALMALARRAVTPLSECESSPPTKKGRRLPRLIALLGIAGAALFFADGMITPAISVLSAVEGLHVAAPSLAHFTLPLTILILTLLFAVQHHGTARMGAWFGPIILVWFTTLGSLGLQPILQNPDILRALSPLPGLHYLFTHGFTGLSMLGFVFLVATGAEALYADLGHFGKRPIRIAWLSVALPGLLLNYYGQGALALRDPSKADNLFYYLAPEWMTLPLLGMATMATVIASQAVISGTFSMARQAVMLGLTPRLETQHTSPSHIGQVYLPMVNWMLFSGTVLLVLGFQTSTRMASAYGLAVALTMLITAVLLAVYLRRGQSWSWWLCLLVLLPLIFVHVVLVASNVGKLLKGGWLPLLFGLACTVIMLVWQRGQKALQRHTDDVGLTEPEFLQSLEGRHLARVRGAAIVVTRLHQGAPRMLLHLMRATKTLHETVVIVTIDTASRARIPGGEKLQVVSFGQGLYRLHGRYGFMEYPNVPALVTEAERRGLLPALRDRTYLLGRLALTDRKKPLLSWFPRGLFKFLFQNAFQASNYLGIPTSQCIEIGIPVEL